MKAKIICLALIFTTFFANAQILIEEVDQPSFKDRLYYGGNFGFQFSTFAFFVEASPLVGYMFNNQFSAGTGIIYNYFRTNFDNSPNSSHIYGARQFARYNITPNLFGYTELESISVNQSFLNGNAVDVQRVWSVSPFIGLGYVLQIGPRSAMVVTGLYNLYYRPEASIYNRPFLVRLGFTF